MCLYVCGCGHVSVGACREQRSKMTPAAGARDPRELLT